jgi:ACS family tartrate transporter-like MFS transporter
MRPPAEPAAAPSAHSADGAAALARTRRHLLPFLFALYIAAYLDRINVGFAALQMNREIGLGAAAFGFGSGLFFLGYFIFEIPSNLILSRVGARRWIARIMISWGVAACATMLVRGAASFYALRFILGAAEAGFFPGIIFYLSGWFPERERARAIALFMTATALAGVIAGPVSGALLTMHGFGGLSGWQWMFLLEGMPAIAMGVAVALYLPDHPGEARFLNAAERAALTALIAEDAAARSTTHADFRAALASGAVWRLVAIYFLFTFGVYGISFWLPQILAGLGAMSVIEIGFASAVPFAAAALAMVAVARSSDRRGERRIHLALCAGVAAFGFAGAAYARAPLPAMLFITVAAAGTWSCFGPFWAAAAAMLSDAAAAGGIALINSVGNLGGFAGPYVVGIVRGATHSFAAAMLAMGAALALGGLLVLLSRDRR